MTNNHEEGLSENTADVEAIYYLGNNKVHGYNDKDWKTLIHAMSRIIMGLQTPLDSPEYFYGMTLHGKDGDLYAVVELRHVDSPRRIGHRILPRLQQVYNAFDKNDPTTLTENVNNDHCIPPKGTTVSQYILLLSRAHEEQTSKHQCFIDDLERFLHNWE